MTAIQVRIEFIDLGWVAPCLTTRGARCSLCFILVWKLRMQAFMILYTSRKLSIVHSLAKTILLEARLQETS